MSTLLESTTTFIGTLHPWVLGSVIVALFAGSVLFVPWAVVQIPDDYFKTTARRPALWRDYPPILRALMMLAKNMAGLLLVLVGVTMVFLPGPGIVTLLIGLLMLDVPGKFRFERWLISHEFILKPVNWLRQKKHKGALQLD